MKKTLSSEPKMPYFYTFRPEFEKTIVIFEFNTFEFVKMQGFMLKKNLGTKIALLGYFLDWNLKKLFSYLKSASSNLSKSRA